MRRGGITLPAGRVPNSYSAHWIACARSTRMVRLDKDGKPGPLNDLKGKLDFTRIGVMGHSRGGQGVSTAILFNETRSG